METTIFGNTELSVSRLGFGAGPIGLLDTPQEQVLRVLDYLFDQGVNVIDTAALYRGSEAAIGDWFSRSGHRDDIVLISKCGSGDEDLPGEPWSKQRLTASIDRSLERLGTDHLDVMLLHSCDQNVLEQGEAIQTLMDAVEAGKVRLAGYSGDNEPAQYAAGLDELSVIEMSVNIADQHNIDHALARCIEHDKAVIAKRPIANAAWKDQSAQRGMYQAYASEYSRRLAVMGLTPHELGYYGHTEVEWPEVALKFTLAVAGIHTAITGTTSTVNAQANIAAVEKNPLREQAVARIREAFTKAQQSTGETWVGQT